MRSMDSPMQGKHIPAERKSSCDSVAAGNILKGIWRLGDPKISLASIAGMFLGACAAAADGTLDWPWLFVTVVGILAIEAAKNASGDIFDFDSGADIAVADEDRSPFSGGKRVIIDGLLTRAQTAFIAALFYLVGIVAGLAIVMLREPSVLWIGLAGVALAYFYNAPPVRLSYRGVGEIAVAVTYGPLICCGTYLVQRHDLPLTVLILAVPLGLLIAAFLVINEFPDWNADSGAGKRNLVVRLGEDDAAWLYLSIIVVAYLAILLLPLSGLPLSVWFGLAGLPFAAASSRRVLSTRVTAQIIPAQRWMLISFVLTAMGCGIGLLL